MNRRILVVDADPALYGLLEEWLAALDCSVLREGDAAQDGFDLIVADIPFPRQGGQDVLRRLAAEHAGTPVVALSSSFFPGIERNGAVARALGVACVLPKPLTRESLVTALDQTLQSAP